MPDRRNSGEEYPERFQDRKPGDRNAGKIGQPVGDDAEYRRCQIGRSRPARQEGDGLGGLAAHRLISPSSRAVYTAALPSGAAQLKSRRARPALPNRNETFQT